MVKHLVIAVDFNSTHPQINFGNRVLLVNLETPDSTNWWDIRTSQRIFVDRRVIEVNPFREIILNLFILTFRP